MDNIVGSQYFLSFNFVFVLLMKSRIQYDLRNLIHSPSSRLSRTDFDPLEFNSVHYNLRVTSRNPSFESMRLRSERNPKPTFQTHNPYHNITVVCTLSCSYSSNWQGLFFSSAQWVTSRDSRELNTQ
jgi:hypothetical protein